MVFLWKLFAFVLSSINGTVCAYLIIQTLVDVKSSKGACADLGMQQVTIRDATTYDEVSNYLHRVGPSNDLWVGMYWDTINQVFRWSDNDARVVETINWGANEPNCMTAYSEACKNSAGSTHQNCVILDATVAKLMTTYCDVFTKYYSFCQDRTSVGSKTGCEQCPTPYVTTDQRLTCEPCPTCDITTDQRPTCEQCPTCDCTTEQRLTCEPCPTNAFTTDQQVECEPCPTSDVTANIHITCEPCPTCDVTTIQQITCKPCPTLNVTTNQQVTCEPCPTYDVITDQQVTCKPCPHCNDTYNQNMSPGTTVEKTSNQSATPSSFIDKTLFQGSFLAIKKENTGSYRRQRTSAYDGRFSSKMIGLTGVTILVIVCCIFPTVDMVNFVGQGKPREHHGRRKVLL